MLSRRSLLRLGSLGAGSREVGLELGQPDAAPGKTTGIAPHR